MTRDTIALIRLKGTGGMSMQFSFRCGASDKSVFWERSVPMMHRVVVGKGSIELPDHDLEGRSARDVAGDASAFAMAALSGRESFGSPCVLFYGLVASGVEYSSDRVVILGGREKLFSDVVLMARELYGK